MRLVRRKQRQQQGCVYDVAVTPLCVSLHGVNKHHPGGEVTIGPATISRGSPNNLKEPEAMRPADLDAIDAALLELDHREKVDAPAGVSRRLYKLIVQLRVHVRQVARPPMIVTFSGRILLVRLVVCILVILFECVLILNLEFVRALLLLHLLFEFILLLELILQFSSLSSSSSWS